MCIIMCNIYWCERTPSNSITQVHTHKHNKYFWQVSTSCVNTIASVSAKYTACSGALIPGRGETPSNNLL